MEQRIKPTVYGAEGCGQCFLTVRAFKNEGIEVEERSFDDPIEGDMNRDAAVSLGMMGAPVVIYGRSGDDMWFGLRPERIKELSARIRAQQ